jgi:hypothetical protein
MQQGMGIDGTINVPVWNSSIGVYYGNYAIIDHEGNIVFQRSSTLSKSARDGAPGNFRFVNVGDAELDIAVKSDKYTVEPYVRYVSMNNASGTVTLPAANTSVDRLITIFNDHKSAALNVVNTLPGSAAVIPAGCLMTYRSNGENWKAILNPCSPSK